MQFLQGSEAVLPGVVLSMTNGWGRDAGIVEYLELTIKMKAGKEAVHHREILAAPALFSLFTPPNL